LKIELGKKFTPPLPEGLDPLVTAVGHQLALNVSVRNFAVCTCVLLHNGGAYIQLRGRTTFMEPSREDMVFCN